MQRLKSIGFERFNAIAPPGLFRLTLAYAVVVGHFSAIHLGTAAVYLFFVLSGYWIYRMWLSEYREAKAPWLTFLVSRAWRLLPVYYVSLSVCLVLNFAFRNHVAAVPTSVSSAGWAAVQEMFIGIREFPSAAGFDALHAIGANLAILGYASIPSDMRLLPPVWSLDIECQFYIIAPLIIAALIRTKSKSVARSTLFIAAFAGLAGGMIAYLRATDSVIQGLTGNLLFFLIGSHAANTNWRPSERVASVSLYGTLATVVLLIVVPQTRELFYTHKTHGHLGDYAPVGNLAVAALLVPYAIATLNLKVTKDLFFGRYDRVLGNISYEVYLLHVNFQLVIDQAYGHLTRIERLPIVVLSLLLLFPFSLAVYLAVDRPIDRLRVAWVRARRIAGKLSDETSDRPLGASVS